MFSIIKLIRFRTLAFVIFTLYAMRYFVLHPLLTQADLALQLPEEEFALLVLSICCLVSAAYVINDYFDTKSDRLSDAREVIVGKVVSRRVAIILHSVLNLMAVAGAVYLGYRLHYWPISLLFMGVSVVLWFYSSHYKKQFMLNNLLVAFLTALIPFVGVGCECLMLKGLEINFLPLFMWTAFFSYFLLLNMWMYEVNKDIYSLQGDRDEQTCTLPVQLGVERTREMIVKVAGGAIFSLAASYFVLFFPSISVACYFVFALGIPYVLYGYSVLKPLSKTLQLRLIRLIMVLCVGFSFCLPYFLMCAI